MMNTREEFEKWFKSLEKPIIGPRIAWIIWQACQALNDKRIAELEEKLRVTREALSDINKLAGTQEFAHLDTVIAKNIAFSTLNQLMDIEKKVRDEQLPIMHA